MSKSLIVAHFLSDKTETGLQRKILNFQSKKGRTIGLPQIVWNTEKKYYVAWFLDYMDLTKLSTQEVINSK